MSDRAALLAAIIANPDEDTPRLVYADWLDENGEAKRAAYIRAQIAQNLANRAGTPASAVAGYLANDLNKWGRVDWGRVDTALGAVIAAQRASETRAHKLKPRAEGVPRIKGVEFWRNARGVLR